MRTKYELAKELFVDGGLHGGFIAIISRYFNLDTNQTLGFDTGISGTHFDPATGERTIMLNFRSWFTYHGSRSGAFSDLNAACSDLQREVTRTGGRLVEL